MLAEWIDRARYWVAVLYVVSIPPALAWWFVVHPFAHFWRRLGAKLSLWLLGTGYLAAVALLFLVRERLIGADLGANLPLFLLGIPLYLVCVSVALRRRKQLTLRILAGAPELSPERAESVLLTEGVYSRIRHPRYLEFLLGSVAFALFLNYMGVYVMTAVAILGILLIVPLEERELLERFGEDYERYSERVPRFIPRFLSSSGR